LATTTVTTVTNSSLVLNTLQCFTTEFQSIACASMLEPACLVEKNFTNYLNNKTILFFLI
jgi:hypothetical protein